MRNLTDVNWPEIYVFMESKTSLVSESKLDYRIIPKGRAEFLLKHLVNAVPVRKVMVYGAVFSQITFVLFSSYGYVLIGL